MKTRVLFMYGGNSVEHEISILTALQAMENIDSSKYDVSPGKLSGSGTFMSRYEAGTHRTKKRTADAASQRMVSFCAAL